MAVTPTPALAAVGGTPAVMSVLARALAAAEEELGEEEREGARALELAARVLVRRELLLPLVLLVLVGARGRGG